jgi:hypothetical protein
MFLHRRMGDDGGQVARLATHRWRAAAAIATALVVVATGTGFGPAAADIAVDTEDRDAVRDAYLELKAYRTTPIGWTGSTDTCTAGTISGAARQASLDAINLIREMAGRLPVTLDASFDADAQQAALMMHANGTLSHDPQPDWRCYTWEGDRGAGGSNLALAGSQWAGAADPILLYMADPGSSNTSVGHRRWILDSSQDYMGVGATSRAHALGVLGVPLDEPVGDLYTSWPTDGWFPHEIEPQGRWSFHARSPRTGETRHDLSAATVEVEGPDGPLPITVYPAKTSYGDHSISWQMPAGFRDPTADEEYTVTVDGIKVGATKVSHTYTVRLFQADPPPPPPPTTTSPPTSLPKPPTTVQTGGGPGPAPVPPVMPVGGAPLAVVDGRNFGLLGWAWDPDSRTAPLGRVVIEGVSTAHVWPNWTWAELPARSGYPTTDAMVYLAQLPPGTRSVCFDAMDPQTGAWTRLQCHPVTVK